MTELQPRASNKVALLHFRSGQLRLGLAASAVEGLFEHSANTPHIAGILSMPVAEARNELRTMVLQACGKRARFLIEGPVATRELCMSDFLHVQLRLLHSLPPALIGFARSDEHILLILNAAWLVERGNS